LGNDKPFYVDSLGNLWGDDYSPVSESHNSIDIEFTESDLFEEFEQDSYFYF
jgi:hypothetical protein